MIDNELAYSSASDLVRLIAAKEVSPVELTDLFFRRIDELDPKLNSFLLLTRDLAAFKAAKERPRTRLCGATS